MLTINTISATAAQVAQMLNTAAAIATTPAEVKTIAAAEFDTVRAEFQISSEGFLMATVGTAKDSIVMMFDADNFNHDCNVMVQQALVDAASR
jgi:hypothetical protein